MQLFRCMSFVKKFLSFQPFPRILCLFLEFFVDKNWCHEVSVVFRFTAYYDNFSSFIILQIYGYLQKVIYLGCKIDFFYIWINTYSVLKHLGNKKNILQKEKNIILKGHNRASFLFSRGRGLDGVVKMRIPS